MQMRILFINPPNTPFTSREILIAPIDILNLASFVESLGHYVEILDMDAKKLKATKIKHYTNFDYVVAVYDNHIPLHKDNAFLDLKYIGDFYNKQNIPTILVGKVGTYLPSVLKDINFKIAVLGGKNQEGVLKQIFAAKELEKIKNIAYLSNGKIIENEKDGDVFDINLLPLSNRKLLDARNYIDVASILTSRGCINNCKFCPVKNYWGNWQGKSAKLVVKEIEHLCNLGYKKIIFLDDNASCDSKRLEEISKEIIAKKIDVQLGLLASINTYSKEIFKLMYLAGFRWVHFGIESGSQEVLKNINKSFDVEKAKQIILELKQIGYRVRTSIIFDLNPVTEENLNKTINFLKDAKPQEIRLHYLVNRLGASMGENRKGNVQYIHNSSVVNKQDKDLQLLESKKNELLKWLKSQGYIVVKNAEKWKKLAKQNCADLKFISFCPSRYGLGW